MFAPPCDLCNKYGCEHMTIVMPTKSETEEEQKKFADYLHSELKLLRSAANSWTQQDIEARKKSYDESVEMYRIKSRACQIVLEEMMMVSKACKDLHCGVCHICHEPHPTSQHKF